MNNTGTLSATSSGSISQATGTNFNSTGFASFSSATGDVQISTVGNSFIGGNNLTATTVLTPTVASAALPAPTSSPAPLQVTSGNGSVTSSGGTTATTTSIPQVTGGADASTGGSSGSTADVGGVGGGGVSISLVRQPSLQQTGIISVSVPKEMATAGSGFSFPLPAQVINTAADNATITVTTVTGQSLPSWLKFNSDTKTFVASAVPDGAFPMQVLVIVGGRSTTIVISERGQ